MWLDVIIAVIFISSAALGFRQGLFSTAIHTFGWIAAVILGFAWSPALNLFLREHTGWFEYLQDAILIKFSENSETAAEPILNLLPKTLGGSAGQAAESLAGLLFQIFVFFGTIMLIGLLFSLLSGVFSKRKGSGFLSFGDGAAGLLTGSFRGILLVFLFLAFLVPAEILSPESGIQAALETSRIAWDLYDNNFLLLLVKNGF